MSHLLDSSQCRDGLLFTFQSPWYEGIFQSELNADACENLKIIRNYFTNDVCAQILL